MQVTNNKLRSQTSFGMAFIKPNTKGMPVEYINAITASKKLIDELAKDVDIEVKLNRGSEGFNQINGLNVVVSELSKSLLGEIKKIFGVKGSDNAIIDANLSSVQNGDNLYKAAKSAKLEYEMNPKVVATKDAVTRELKAKNDKKNAAVLKAADELKRKVSIEDLNAAFGSPVHPDSPATPPKNYAQKDWGCPMLDDDEMPPLKKN